MVKTVKTAHIVFGCIIFGLVVFTLNLFTPSVAAKNARAKFAQGELLIKMRPQGNIDDVRNKFRVKNSVRVLDRFNISGDKLNKLQKVGLDRLYKVEVDGNEDVMNLSRQLQSNPNVEYAEPNYEVSTTATPNDPSFNLLWGLHNNGQTGGQVDADIDASEGWDVNTNSVQLLVGIIDTGVDYNHPDLQSNMWVNQAEFNGQPGVDDDGNGFVDDIHGYDFANNDPDPIDDHGHGTHVAGTIGAVGNNGIGVAGINWSAKIMAVKFLNNFGSGYIDGAVQALLYANMMGAKITNNSWGGGGYSQALSDAISAADMDGDLFVAAAGNNASNNDLYAFYPASYTNKNVITVAATDSNDNLASFSNYGATTVHVAAPGVSIYSTVPISACSLCDPSGYKYLSGTSMATPHVVGSAALVWAHNSSFTHDQVKARIINTADPVNSLVDKSVSDGRLNLFNAFEDDTVPPAPITDLVSSGKSYNQVGLRWTAVGDDGDLGQASKYDVRFSTTPIDAVNFDTAQKAVNPPKPQTAGVVQTMTVNGLGSSTTYYFAVKSVDNVGNFAGISNVIQAVTDTPQVLFNDDFESSPSSWIVDGSTGNASASGTLWHLSERRSANPTHAFYYGKEDTGAYNTGFTNWGTLTSELIDLSGAASPGLVFKHFLKTENTIQTPVFDKASVEISLDGGLTWATVLVKGTTNDSWVQESIGLSGFGGTLLKIRFRFDTVDSLYNDFEGWFIDDVQILGQVNKKPVANPGGPYTGNEDQVTTFDGSGSTDEENQPLTYEWDFGDGQSAATQMPTVGHTYANPGQYRLTLVVNDGQLNSDPKSTTVTINDITAPTVAITAPVDNSSVSGMVTITAEAVDNVGVTMVDFLVDGVVVGRDSTSPYINSWDSNNSVGSHILSANAYDGAGNIKSSAPLNVTVLDVQVPSIVITNPLNNSTVKRGAITTITTNTSDNVGVAKVEFYVNNALKCADTTAPHTCNWPVPSKPNVLYTIVGIAYDAAGNNSGVSVKTTSK